MSHITKVKVAMNLRKQPVSIKIAKARHYVTSMTGNANFATPNPTLASVTTAINALETAANNAAGGGTELTAIMHEKETIVDNRLTQLGAYVEGIANNDPPNAASIVLSAGMDLKKPNVPVGPVATPQNLRADFGAQPGQIKLRCKKSVGTTALIWEMMAGALPAPLAAPAVTWVPVSNADFPSGVTSASKHIAMGLVSGISYSFRVSAVGAVNQSGWSDVAAKTAP
ncbi:MAG TPA: hypothetical protein VJ111_08930 [Chitinophagaceae bacterium]|nr:hypothetical protein [Chitinophagaceae bacterium]